MWEVLLFRFRKRDEIRTGVHHLPYFVEPLSAGGGRGVCRAGGAGGGSAAEHIIGWPGHRVVARSSGGGLTSLLYLFVFGFILSLR